MAYRRVVLTERDSHLNLNNGVNVAKKQLEKFDNSYTSKKLNELYKEFDAITFNTPSISSVSLTEPNVMVEKTSVSFRTKLYLTSAILITLILAFLAIYNIFVINKFNSGIKWLQEEVSIAETDYKNLYDYNKQLSNLNNINNRIVQEGFGEISSNTINIPLIEIKEVSDLVVKSNWFNDLCNFIGGLFGG